VRDEPPPRPLDDGDCHRGAGPVYPRIQRGRWFLFPAVTSRLGDDAIKFAGRNVQLLGRVSAGCHSFSFVYLPGVSRTKLGVAGF
jgi:hypothetical protein